jgi:hypothetical protein
MTKNLLKDELDKVFIAINAPGKNFEEEIIKALEDEDPGLAEELKNRLSALRKHRGKLKKVTTNEIILEIERFLENKLLTRYDAVDYKFVVEETAHED